MASLHWIKTGKKLIVQHGRAFLFHSQHYLGRKEKSLRIGKKETEDSAEFDLVRYTNHFYQTNIKSNYLAWGEEREAGRQMTREASILLT